MQGTYGGHVMSGKPPPLIFTWQRAVRDSDLPLTTKGVAFILATYANRDGSGVHPGNRRLEQDTGLSDKPVRRHLAALRAAGLIERTHRARSGRPVPGGDAMADVYRLTLPGSAVAGDRTSEHGSAVAGDGSAVAGVPRSAVTSDRPPTHNLHQPNNHQHEVPNGTGPADARPLAEHRQDRTPDGDRAVAQEAIRRLQADPYCPPLTEADLRRVQSLSLGPWLKPTPARQCRYIVTSVKGKARQAAAKAARLP
jgi:hypothetical protein